jgi:ABC-type nickel/cobalt efflux system permease component RcnA
MHGVAPLQFTARSPSDLTMFSLLSIIALGFFLGMRHATDPDHVIAVTTIVARHRKVSHAALIGAFWGVGHTLTILVVGGGIILFGWVIPTRIGLSMEFSVGLMLILLGVLNLTGMLQWITDRFSPGSDAHGILHSHPHAHGDYIHTHPHSHDPEAHPHASEQTPLNWFDRHFGRIGLYQGLRPLLVGLVHGLAGSAAVALLVLTTIRNPKWALVYLLVFGIGTIAGMMLITGAIVLPFAYAEGKFTRLNQGLRLASGLISLGFGLFLVYQIGFVSGLFTSHPQWTPR